MCWVGRGEGGDRESEKKSQPDSLGQTLTNIERDEE